MLTGGNWNLPDTNTGYLDEILAKRDAILARLPLDRYARARILGGRATESVQPRPPKVAPLPTPKREARVGRYFSLPEIASAAAGAWRVTFAEMCAARRGNYQLQAVFAAASLARVFSTMGYAEVSYFFRRRNGKSAYEWVVRDRELQRDDPIYRERYDAAKRALEACR